MSLRVDCRACGKKFQVGDQLAGKAFACKGCGEIIRIPQSTANDAADHSDRPRTKTRAESRPPRRESRRHERRPRRPEPEPEQRPRRRQPTAPPKQQAPVWITVMASVGMTLVVLVTLRSFLFADRNVPVTQPDTVARDTTSSPLPPQRIVVPQQAEDQQPNQKQPEIKLEPKDAAPITIAETPRSRPSVAQPAAATNTQPPLSFEPDYSSPLNSQPRIPEPKPSAQPAGQPSNPASTSTVASADPVDSQQTPTNIPGWYGKSGYAINIPEGWMLTTANDDVGSFECEWRLEDSTSQSPATIELSIRFDARFVADSKPAMMVTRGTIRAPMEVYMATGGTIKTPKLDGVQFYQLIYPYPKKIMWHYLAHFNGARVRITGNCLTTADERKLKNVAETFRRNNTDARVPVLPGFGHSAPAQFAGIEKKPKPRAEVDGAADSAVGKDNEDQKKAGWGSGGGSIPLGRGTGDTMYLSGNPPKFVLAGRRIYDIATSDEIAELPAELAEGKCAISPDGKRVAHVRNSNEAPVIYIYATENPAAAPVRIESKDEPWRISLLKFLSNDRLIMRAGNSQFTVFNTATSQVLKQFNGVYNDALAISDDGIYIATHDRGGSVMVYDTIKGRSVARMANQDNGRKLEMFWCHGLAFSPDMAELAGLFGDGQFVVWSAKGDIVSSEILADMGSGVGQSNTLSWLPDGSGWLVSGGKLLDRKTMTFVWLLEGRSRFRKFSRILDQDHVIVQREHSFPEQELATIEIPWQQIRGALNQVDPEAGLLLKKGDSISLKINIAQTRFADRQQVATQISEHITKRLTATGLALAGAQKLTLVVDYSEAEGKQRRVSSSMIPFGRPRSDDRQVMDTQITADIKLMLAGRTEPVWKTSLRGEVGLIMEGEINETSIRKEAYESILRSFGRLSVPTRISGNGSGELPIRTNVGS